MLFFVVVELERNQISSIDYCVLLTLRTYFVKCKISDCNINKSDKQLILIRDDQSNIAKLVQFQQILIFVITPTRQAQKALR